MRASSLRSANTSPNINRSNPAGGEAVALLPLAQIMIRGAGALGEDPVVGSADARHQPLHRGGRDGLSAQPTTQTTEGNSLVMLWAA